MERRSFDKTHEGSWQNEERVKQLEEKWVLHRLTDIYYKFQLLLFQFFQVLTMAAKDSV